MPGAFKNHLGSVFLFCLGSGIAVKCPLFCTHARPDLCESAKHILTGSGNCQFRAIFIDHISKAVSLHAVGGELNQHIGFVQSQQRQITSGVGVLNTGHAVILIQDVCVLHIGPDLSAVTFQLARRCENNRASNLLIGAFKIGENLERSGAIMGTKTSVEDAVYIVQE